jgi:hypothetical protein
MTDENVLGHCWNVGANDVAKPAPVVAVFRSANGATNQLPCQRVLLRRFDAAQVLSRRA